MDRDLRSIVLAQGFEATVDKPQAPGTKASSLHQAVNWLFGSEQESGVPERLRSAWREVHEALAEGAIDDVEVWFVHNLPESAGIQTELDAAANAAYILVTDTFTVPVSGSFEVASAVHKIPGTTLLGQHQGVSRQPEGPRITSTTAYRTQLGQNPGSSGPTTTALPPWFILLRRRRATSKSEG